MSLASESHNSSANQQYFLEKAYSRETLQCLLEKAWADTDWWWRKCEWLEQQLHESISLRISSPLCTQERWVNAPSSTWSMGSWYAASCPCCKRPLDVTILRAEQVENCKQDARDYTGVTPSSDIQEGTSLRCASLPHRNDALPIWKSAREFESIGMIPIGDMVVAAGPIDMVDGYPMVPIQPEGIIDGRFVQVVQPEPIEKDQPDAFEATVDYLMVPAGMGLQPRDRTDIVEIAEKFEAQGQLETQMQPAASGITMSGNCTQGEAAPKFAYCAVLWGANAGYVLGALVLGARLKALSSNGFRADLVMLHTDDVPLNFVAALAKYWDVVRQVEYIDAVDAMYLKKGSVFDGVFTKLAAWGLTEYDKVLLLDLDVIPLRLPEEIFELEPPAALVRGNGEDPHGLEVDGRRFFVGDMYPDGDHSKYAWCQSGGINAGVILLRPCRKTLEQMLAEVTSELHPEHLPSPGPEQDYLTRFFASAPWHALDVRWNYQIHHIPFAFEHVLSWRRSCCNMDKVSNADREWLPRRLAIGLDDVGIVHFSGDVKLWHLCLDSSATDGDHRRAVEHAPVDKWKEVSTFSEHLLRECCANYDLWVGRTAAPEEYEALGCILLEGGRIELGEGDAREDITAVLDNMVERLRGTAQLATATWRRCAEQLLIDTPTLLEDLRMPEVAHDSFAPGKHVEVRWSYPGDDHYLWLPARVASVHRDGRHVVRYDRGGDWGDTERGVARERIRELVG